MTAPPFEDVALATVERALERQRREHDARPLARASLANLVVVTAGPEAAGRALPLVEALGPRAPSRCVLLVVEPRAGRPAVRARARVCPREGHHGGAAPASLAWDEIVLHASIAPRYLAALVLPLLLPGLPVFTWWPGTPPFADPVFDELSAVTNRLVVDSALFADPAGDLPRLARAASALEAATSDCAWGRITPWRELLAAPFNAPHLAGALDAARALEVDAVEPTAGLHLAGWLAGRLGWELEQARLAGDARLARYRTGDGGTCRVRVAPAAGSGPLARAELRLDTGGGPVTVRVEARPGRLEAAVEEPGHPAHCRTVSGPAEGAPSGLAAELAMLGRDRVFEEALAPAAALAAAGT